jgi:hypothetical protein
MGSMKMRHTERISRFHARRRWRHPWEKGDPIQRQIGEAFRFLLEGRTWKRHPAPFNKTERGRERRAEKRFVIANKRAFA